MDGIPGSELCKPFGILIEGEGEGGAPIADIAHDREAKPLTTKDTKEHIRMVASTGLICVSALDS